jgi:hypothetical protein
LAWNFGNYSAKISIDVLSKTNIGVKAKYLRKGRKIQKKRRHTCLSISVKSSVFFFNFLGGFSATELLALFEPCQVKSKKLLSVDSTQRWKAKIRKSI